MGNFVNRTDLSQYRRSVNDPEFLDPPWLYVPPGSNNEVLLTTVVPQYLTIAGDIISEVDQATKDAIDAAALEASRDDTANRMDNIEDIVRAFAMVTLDEINVLRAEHALPDRTLAQMKTAVRGKLGT
jgi:hypothetical protein